MKNKADKAIAYASRLLGVRPRSERELRDRLYRKGLAAASVNGAVSYLKEKHIIDDFKFAKLWVESRMHTSPKGDRLLRKELRDKGVSSAIIDRVLSEKGDTEESLVKELAEKRLATLKSLPREKARKRLFGYLARRGFKFDIIEEVVSKTVS